MYSFPKFIKVEKGNEIGFGGNSSWIAAGLLCSEVQKSLTFVILVYIKICKKDLYGISV